MIQHNYLLSETEMYDKINKMKVLVLHNLDLLDFALYISQYDFFILNIIKA